MTGNRDRNKQEKRERIFAAADELFGAHGYAAVSTQQIADHAQVAAGTIFRYASSKGELLLMVMNEGFRAGIAEGRDRARTEPDTAAAILALLTPILDRSAPAPENSHVYQRELMFGTAGERFHDEGLALIAELEAAIAELITAGAERDRRALAAADAELAADAVFALLHLAVTRFASGLHDRERTVTGLRTQIGQIVAGTIAAAPEISHENTPTGKVKS